MSKSWIDKGDNKGAENTENTISKILTQDVFLLLLDSSESNLRDVAHFGSKRYNYSLDQGFQSSHDDKFYLFRILFIII